MHPRAYSTFRNPTILNILLTHLSICWRDHLCPYPLDSLGIWNGWRLDVYIKTWEECMWCALVGVRRENLDFARTTLALVIQPSKLWVWHIVTLGKWNFGNLLLVFSPELRFRWEIAEWRQIHLPSSVDPRLDASYHNILMTSLIYMRLR